MKKILQFEAAIIAMTTFCSACVDINDIWLLNDSADSIVVRYFYAWPDTQLCTSNTYAGRAKETVLIPPAKNELLVSVGDYDDIKILFRHTDTLSAYVIHLDTLRRYGWYGVEAHRAWLHRFDVSYRDLNRANGKLRYPPN